MFNFELLKTGNACFQITDEKMLNNKNLEYFLKYRGKFINNQMQFYLHYRVVIVRVITVELQLSESI